MICFHAGKIIGGFCALSGVFILTLPIPIVVNSNTNRGKTPIPTVVKLHYQYWENSITNSGKTPITIEVKSNTNSEKLQ